MTNRFWINYPPAPQAPKGDLFAIVDEEAGGEIAYTISIAYAEKIVSALKLLAGTEYPKR